MANAAAFVILGVAGAIILIAIIFLLRNRGCTCRSCLSCFDCGIWSECCNFFCPKFIWRFFCFCSCRRTRRPRAPPSAPSTQATQQAVNLSQLAGVLPTASPVVQHQAVTSMLPVSVVRAEGSSAASSARQYLARMEAQLAASSAQYSYDVPAAAVAAPFSVLPTMVSKVNGDELEIPIDYICVITSEMMLDPVMTSDGHTYDRSAIQRWLEQHDTSPKTGAKLPNKMLVPNLTLRDDMTAWMKGLNNDFVPKAAHHKPMREETAGSVLLNMCPDQLAVARVESVSDVAIAGLHTPVTTPILNNHRLRERRFPEGF